jgi:hypothetical protein
MGARLRSPCVELRLKFARGIVIALGVERYSVHLALWPLHLELRFL